ncbi:MAG: DMT family transporter [Salibacteraceae bacterium]
MIHLLLSIVCATLILVIFKMIGRQGIVTRHVIMINYAVAGLFGILFFRPGPEVVAKQWFWPAALMGLGFYTVFQIIAKTTQESGLAAASIATRMSVVIPVAIGIAVLDESRHFVKIAAIVLGLLAVYLSTGKPGSLKSFMWPMLAFFGSGLIDSSFKLFQVWSVGKSDFATFSTVIFSFAFVIAFVHHIFMRDLSVKPPAMVAGTILGVVNFGSLYFIMHALAIPQMESSVVFPINNVGVVVLSTLFATLFFREKICLTQWVGLSLAVISIVILSLWA